MENLIPVIIGVVAVAAVYHIFFKDDKKKDSKPSYGVPVSEKNQPKRGPGSTPKKTSQKKKPATAKKAAPKKTAKKAAPKKAAPKKSAPKKGSAKPKLQVK